MPHPNPENNGAVRGRIGHVSMAALVVLVAATPVSVTTARSAAAGAPARPVVTGAAAPAAGPSLAWHAHALGPSALSAVACASHKDCFAFGLGGSLLESADGGGTWTATSVAVARHLMVLAAACPSNTQCVALAARPPVALGRGPSRGVALVSHDAGKTWHTAPVAGPAVLFLGGLSCPTPTTCDATAAPVSGERPAGVLLVSLDSGASWTVRRPGPAGGLTGALACPTVRVCVATGGTGTVRTYDGGHHWMTAKLPLGGGGRSGIRSIACSSVARCVAAGSEPHPGTPVVLESDDGGATWRFVPAPAIRAGSALIGTTGGYDAVSCHGPICVAVGDTLPAVGLVAESRDAGRTWTTLGLSRGGAFAAVTCAASAGCLVAGTTANGAPTLALRATDGSWSTPYVGSGTEWSALSCPTSSDCVAAGASGPVPVGVAVMVTHDGGADWLTGHLPSGLTGMTALSCPTTAHCVALANVTPGRQLTQDGNVAVTAVLVSEDGGVTWSRRALAGGALVLDALTCPTPRNCVAVGVTPQRPGTTPLDAITSTTDGGTHWRRAAVPSFPPPPAAGTSGSEILGGGLASVSCFSPRSCIAGGSAGVLSTTDGTHWSVVERTPGPGAGGLVSGGILFGQLQMLSCAARDRCVGAFTLPTATSLRLSTDGGRRWHRVASTPVGLDGLTCPSRAECLAAGSGRHGAVVLQSRDGGQSFHAAPLPALSGAALPAMPAPAYSTLACAGPTACMALGLGATGEVAVATAGAAPLRSSLGYLADIGLAAAQIAACRRR